MHAQLDLTDWQEAFFEGQERVLLVGVDRLTHLGSCFAMLSWVRRSQRQIHQVGIMVDPDVQDGFLFHLMRLGIVGPYLVPYMQLANRLFTLLGPHARI